MTPGDIPDVVVLQSCFLDGSTITELGPHFLRAFHAAALAHPATHAFVAHEEGVLAGFVLASHDMHAFNRAVKPKVLFPVARSLLSPRGVAIGLNLVKGLFEREPEPYMPAELLLLVVDSRLRRRGIGQRLLHCLEGAFAASAVAKYRVAVRSHLTVARSFYQATGFEVEQELMVLGRPMTYLTKQVTLK